MRIVLLYRTGPKAGLYEICGIWHPNDALPSIVTNIQYHDRLGTAQLLCVHTQPDYVVYQEVV